MRYQRDLRRLLVLTYHDVADVDDRDAVTREAFRAQMAVLAEAAGHHAHPDEMWDDPLPEPNNTVVLTFDDGCASHHAVAFPELAGRSHQAVFFLTTEWVGRPGRLSWSQAREMAAVGMEFGSHGVTHRPLSSLTNAELAAELADSKAKIEDELSLAVHFLAVPGGFYNSAVEHAARDAGYEGMCTSDWGVNFAGSMPYRLKRVAVDSSLDAAELKRIVRGDAFSLPRRTVASMSSALQRSLPPSAYRRLDRALHLVS